MLKYLLVPLESGLRITPPWLLLILAGLLAWHATRKLSLAALFVLLLYAIGAFGLWDKLMQTLALMLVATVLSIVLGIPLGILCSQNRWVRRGCCPCST